jgi:hypothetical protein
MREQLWQIRRGLLEPNDEDTVIGGFDAKCRRGGGAGDDGCRARDYSEIVCDGGSLFRVNYPSPGSDEILRPDWLTVRPTSV